MSININTKPKHNFQQTSSDSTQYQKGDHSNSTKVFNSLPQTIKIKMINLNNLNQY